MRKIQSFILFTLIIVLVAWSSCYLGFHFICHFHPHSHPQESHEGIHQQLNISPEQHAALKPFEHLFSEKKKSCKEQVRLANRELAEAILEDQDYTAKVSSALEKIHLAHGELQKVTLEHVFEMKKILTPQQYNKLLDLTATALYQDPSHP